MINELELNSAFKTKDQAYNLLIWLNSAIKKGIINPVKAMEYTTSFMTAKGWVVEHYLNLPEDSRPDSRDPKDIDSFINMFLSQFSSSFDIQIEPGQRYIPHDLRTKGDTFVDNPHIRPKKISTKDKLKARKLKIDYLQELALELGLQFDGRFFENFVDDCDLKEQIAIATYGLQLIERLHGFGHGLTVVALWREFAWESNGPPKKNFKLVAQSILDAENLIVKELKKKHGILKQ